MLKQPTTQLKKLDISDNPIGDFGAQAIQDGLKHFNNKVIHINFSNTGMKQGGADAIADALKQPDNKVEYIDLSSNQIQKSMGSIADALKQEHNKVKEIDLSNCGFSDHDLEIISDDLKQDHNKIEVIYLRNNNFTNTTYNEEYDCYPIDGLVGAFKDSENLVEIYLSGNKFNDNVFEKIKNSVYSFNKTVKLIGLRGNPISCNENILKELKRLKEDSEVDILVGKIDKQPETITKTPQPTKDQDVNTLETFSKTNNTTNSDNPNNHSYFDDDYTATLMGDNTGYPTVPVNPDTIELCV